MTGWGVKVNTVCELMKGGISNWTILVNWQVSGVNSIQNHLGHLFITALIYHLSTG